MKTMTLSTALAVSLMTSGLAMANSDHGHGAPQGEDSTVAPMGGQADMMQAMMRMMMQMHGGMMGGPGAGPADVRGMMDHDMMQMMIAGSGMMDMGRPDETNPATMRNIMMMRMTEFDADGDGSLSLAEFGSLHSAMMRETMVDRFQHLDADGDGRITGDEMGAPALRLQGTQGPGTPGMMGGQMPPAGN